ncbi:putative serine protease HtrA [Symmachiella macrocystis]|uniref:Putative serine protease HtrA n=2 Tax=Symmachiella macrocystis TaxID=2527985 RepID=A0A5C6B7T0_9PLAN|nr:putative serine protease HtrA [Symmachiella macrocystis]
MGMRKRVACCCCWFLLGTLLTGPLFSAEETETAKPIAADSMISLPSESPLTVQQLAKIAEEAVVEITVTGRRGDRVGLGTGFVIEPDGLIATNLHVIAEARPITVKTSQGDSYPADVVHASDRKLDLALIKIKAENLPALPLGDSDSVENGQPVIALGNPYGLNNSVVSGVISGTREIDGRNMLQLAIPIETGNSGGPLLDMRGRVLGLLTMKAQYTANLGFAMPVNALKKLIETPNPVPIARWLTIGALDPQEWTPHLGATWRQRSGRMTVEGTGSGFGGRSFVLSTVEVPKLPYEVAVTLRLDDESGAAGLVFHSDGNDRHYGFYPSGARMRLTRFDGPDVLSWTILKHQYTPNYRAGDWNNIKVRIEEKRILCYVNDELVFESEDRGMTSGQVGLAKFRDTEAVFKNFQVAKSIPKTSIDPAVASRIEGVVGEIATTGPPSKPLVETLLPDSPASLTVLRSRAAKLEKQAAQLRKLADEIHQNATVAELVKTLTADEEQIDLLQAALLVAKLDNDELDPALYQKEINRMARGIQQELPDDASENDKLAALNSAMFADLGYHGSRTNYYHKSNSYLNEVIDDREGLPISLSVLYMELARRVGLNVVGVGLPGHFIVRHEPQEGDSQLIDPFDGGKFLSRESAAMMLQANRGIPLTDEHLKTATKRDIVIRMLSNLLGLAQEEQDPEGMLRYVTAIVEVDNQAAQSRWIRAVLRFQTERRAAAAEDADWLLEHRPEGINLQRVEELRGILDRPR